MSWDFFPVGFGRPLVKLFALCYRTLVLSVLSVCDVGALRPNGLTDQDETWHTGKPRSLPHCVRWGPSSPPPKGHSPQPHFSAHVCCGQMAGWIMPLGMEVGLGPGDFVLDGDPVRVSKRGGAPNFRRMFIVAKWLDQSRWHLAWR